MRLVCLTFGTKDRHTEMFGRLLVILIALSPLLPGCANTKPVAQADSKSIIRQAEANHEIHGEVGVMYGASAR